MKPLNPILIFLCILLPTLMIADSRQNIIQARQELQVRYQNDFQNAVDDTSAYLTRFESQQSTAAIRYQREKQINFDPDAINIFFTNLAVKFGIEGNPQAIAELKAHTPAMVFVNYDGYMLVTLDDAGNQNSGSELTPKFWPSRPYSAKLANGNPVYFTLDDQMKVYDKKTGRYLQGSYQELRTQTDLLPIRNQESFEEVRQGAITDNVERDVAGAFNRSMELLKRSDINIQLTMPRTIDESIQDVGFMAFIQGYPLLDGEVFNAYGFGAGSVSTRKVYAGTILPSGRHVAYPANCVPEEANPIESLYDPEEAVMKGYFIEECKL